MKSSRIVLASGLVGVVVAGVAIAPTVSNASTISPKPKTVSTKTVRSSGWALSYQEGFSKSAPRGKFLSAYAKTMGAYPYPWTDTSRNVRKNPGYYNPGKTLSASKGVMDTWLHYDKGTKRFAVSAATPKMTPQTYGRYLIKLKVDKIPGYKIAPLLWPVSESWPNDGEIDFPEGDLNGKALSGFHHYASPRGGQAVFNARQNPRKWHVYETRWEPGRVSFYVDGKRVGTTTRSVPNKPMRWVLQMETAVSSKAPSTRASGHVKVDWVKAYRRH